MCDFSNTNTFLRSALYSATTCYELGRLRQLLTSQEDAEGGAIIFIFKKPAQTENPRICPGMPKWPPEKNGITKLATGKELIQGIKYVIQHYPQLQFVWIQSGELASFIKKKLQSFEGQGSHNTYVHQGNELCLAFWGPWSYGTIWRRKCTWRVV